MITSRLAPNLLNRVRCSYDVRSISQRISFFIPRCPYRRLSNLNLTSAKRSNLINLRQHKLAYIRQICTRCKYREVVSFLHYTETRSAGKWDGFQVSVFPKGCSLFLSSAPLAEYGKAYLRAQPRSGQALSNEPTLHQK